MIPRHAIHPAGTFLCQDGAPIQFPESVGCGLVHSRFLDNGKPYTLGKVAPVVGLPPSGINLPLWLWLQKTSGDTRTQFAVDASVSKARLLRAGDAVVQVTDYPQCTRNRVGFRAKAGEVYQTIEICIPNVKGFSRQLNTNRNGQWAGHISGTLPDGRVLFVYVEDAKEKFRGYRFDGGNLYLTIHSNAEPKDVSKEGVRDLNGYITGDFSTKMPPEYAEYLKSDPQISQAALEVAAGDQATQSSDCWLSLDFWLSIGESVSPGAPLVLLDGFESPIWSKPKSSACDMRPVEMRLLGFATNKLANSPRGQLLYGDFAEDVSSYSRVRGSNHYNWVTAAWRAVLRTGNATWYKLATAFSNYHRNGWLDGQYAHAKGLAPWSSPYGVFHCCDSEALLMAFLCDFDYIALEEYQRWQKAFVEPPATDYGRESTVACRMCRVAYAFTNDATWKARADKIETRVTQEVERIKQTSNWIDYGAGLPTSVNYHPLWTDKNLGLGWQCEGVLNVVGLAATGQLESVEGLILYGQWSYAGREIGFGPLGESHVALQMERIYDYYRGKKLTAKRRTVYGTTIQTSLSSGSNVVIEKRDSADLPLRIATTTRKGGDCPPIVVDITDPAGKVTQQLDYRVYPALKFPAIVQAPNGQWVMKKDQQGHVDGWPCAVTSIVLSGPAGRYKIRVWGHDAVLLHGPLQTKCAEWQDLSSGDFSYSGQDAEGNWPVGNVMVGN